MKQYTVILQERNTETYLVMAADVDMAINAIDALVDSGERDSKEINGCAIKFINSECDELDIWTQQGGEDES